MSGKSSAAIELANAASRRLPEWAVWLAGLLPLAWLIWLTVSGGLGVDPVRRIEHDLGKTGLWFLAACLLIPPLRAFTGITLLRHRRALGLLAFTYVTLHIASWFWFEMGLLWAQALRDLIRRPYLFFGISAFLLLLPLALSSNRASIRRLGRHWKRLHLLVWPAAILAVLHYIWQMKVISGEGELWILGLLALGIWRLGTVFAARRRRPRGDSLRSG